jgi:hypothetical protein
MRFAGNSTSPIAASTQAQPDKHRAKEGNQRVHKIWRAVFLAMAKPVSQARGFSHPEGMQDISRSVERSRDCGRANTTGSAKEKACAPGGAREALASFAVHAFGAKREQWC